MKHHIKLFVWAWCLLLWIHCIAVAEDSPSSGKTILRIGTMALVPYGWKDEQGGKHGLVYELNQDIGIRSGMEFTNEIYPLNRLLVMLKDGNLDMLLCLPYQTALEAGDQLAEFVAVNVIAATRKGSGIQTIDDLQGKFLVYIRGLSYAQLEGVPREIHEISSYQQALLFLHNRPKADAAVFSEPAYYYWMQELGLTPDDFGKVVFIGSGEHNWIFVRKGLPQEIREPLKRAVEEVYQSHLYEQLLIKYGKKE